MVGPKRLFIARHLGIPLGYGVIRSGVLVEILNHFLDRGTVGALGLFDHLVAFFPLAAGVRPKRILGELTGGLVLPIFIAAGVFRGVLGLIAHYGAPVCCD